MERSPWFVALLAIGMSACASSRWRGVEVVALGAAESAVAADCGTTLVALRDPSIIETNPLLGQRPSTAVVAAACAAAGAAVWFVGDRTHGAARWVWLSAVVGLGVLNVTHNLNVLNSHTAQTTLTARLAF